MISVLLDAAQRRSGTHNPCVKWDTRHGTLYIGVTNNLVRRLTEHKLGVGSEFVRKYNVNRLVYVELFDPIGKI
jgi:hypothetical protein